MRWLFLCLVMGSYFGSLYGMLVDEPVHNWLGYAVHVPVCPVQQLRQQPATEHVPSGQQPSIERKSSPPIDIPQQSQQRRLALPSKDSQSSDLFSWVNRRERAKRVFYSEVKPEEVKGWLSYVNQRKVWGLQIDDGEIETFASLIAHWLNAHTDFWKENGYIRCCPVHILLRGDCKHLSKADQAQSQHNMCFAATLLVKGMRQLVAVLMRYELLDELPAVKNELVKNALAIYWLPEACKIDHAWLKKACELKRRNGPLQLHMIKDC